MLLRDVLNRLSATADPCFGHWSFSLSQTVWSIGSAHAWRQCTVNHSLRKILMVGKLKIINQIFCILTFSEGYRLLICYWFHLGALAYCFHMSCEAEFLHKHHYKEKPCRLDFFFFLLCRGHFHFSSYKQTLKATHFHFTIFCVWEPQKLTWNSIALRLFMSSHCKISSLHVSLEMNKTLLFGLKVKTEL